MKKVILCLCALVLAAAAVALAADIIHVVKKGETLSAISKRYHVTAPDIMKHNNLASASRIKAGQKLKIPGKPAPAAKPATAPKPASSHGKPAPAVAAPVQIKPDTAAAAAETAVMDTILPETQPEAKAGLAQAPKPQKKPSRMSAKTKYFILVVIQTVISALLSYLIATWVVNRNTGSYKRGA
ncbi:MAG: LysM peptidoglycan-binding domain-containing protein [Candidatus Edwardsbacteria bacterium]|nr:LysM peptidoglycan-binding domain-containing protein [Candidatus Edwardsbacteria bacterium]